MHNVVLFLQNAASHLVALLSGIVGLIVTIIEYARKEPTRAKICLAICLASLFIASGQAWNDEHQNSSALIGEKADLSSRLGSCEMRWQLREAYVSGLQQANLSDRETIDRQQQNLSSQTGLLSGCLLSLEKSSPRLSRKFSVSQISYRKSLTALIISTDQTSKPAGFIKCDNPFSILKIEIARTVSGYTEGPSQEAVSDREYKVQIRGTHMLDSLHPLMLIAYSESPDPGNCSFTSAEFE